jgi:hypothetical protein
MVGYKPLSAAVAQIYHITDKTILARIDQKPEEFVDNYVNNLIEKLPLRLIDLTNNKLIEKMDLVDELKSSRAAHIEKLKSDQGQWPTIMKEATTPIVSYAIFSHRWGKSEPLFADTKSNLSTWRSNPPDDAGVQKLVTFCTKAELHGCHLAWSDTCCIDKTSSAELQESINSMFQWYRGSTLCIVHLAETDKWGTVEAEKKWSDAWFTRGWTLQELLAPRVLKFYTKSWDELISGSGNDKENAKLLEKLKQATGIKGEHIMDFAPGTQHLREKMIWASHRTTTRGEDIAYSLLGIFGVGMHISYGEGSEEAFYRLQEQIIQTTRDHGLFDWYGEPSKRCSMLASHPRCFRVADDPDDAERRKQLEPEPIVKQSFLTKFLCICTGCSCLNACMVQTFSCAVRVEILVNTGEVVNKAESHFSITNNGLQIKTPTIRILHKWPLRNKGGYRRWYLTSAGYKRVKIAFTGGLKKRDEYILLPLTDEVVEKADQRVARVAVLLYKVDNNTWMRAMTKGPIYLKRDRLQVVNEDLLRTTYIR